MGWPGFNWTISDQRSHGRTVKPRLSDFKVTSLSNQKKKDDPNVKTSGVSLCGAGTRTTRRNTYTHSKVLFCPGRPAYWGTCCSKPASRSVSAATRGSRPLSACYRHLWMGNLRFVIKADTHTHHGDGQWVLLRCGLIKFHLVYHQPGIGFQRSRKNVKIIYRWNWLAEIVQDLGIIPFSLVNTNGGIQFICNRNTFKQTAFGDRLRIGKW